MRNITCFILIINNIMININFISLDNLVQKNKIFNGINNVLYTLPIKYNNDDFNFNLGTFKLSKNNDMINLEFINNDYNEYVYNLIISLENYIIDLIYKNSEKLIGYQLSLYNLKNMYKSIINIPKTLNNLPFVEIKNKNINFDNDNLFNVNVQFKEILLFKDHFKCNLKITSIKQENNEQDKINNIINTLIIESDKQTSDQQTSDKQTSDQQTSDKQTSDKQTLDKQISDKQKSEKHKSDKHKSEKYISENITSEKILSECLDNILSEYSENMTSSESSEDYQFLTNDTITDNIYSEYKHINSDEIKITNSIMI